MSWNGKPFPNQAERIMLPGGRVLEDAVVWPGFCQIELRIDPEWLWEAVRSVPTWPNDQPIPFRPTGGDPHWITGAHPALNYRGNELRRSKIWLQDRYSLGLRRYRYTGWQHAVSFATHAVEAVPPVNLLVERLNVGLERSGHEPHNHFIVTAYEDHDDNIGFHSDKDADYAENSYFIVIKLGAARTFAFRELPTEKTPSPFPFWSRVLEAGTAIFVRAKGPDAANNLVQHAVPPLARDVGPSGSIVSRCIETVVPWDEVKRNVAARVDDPTRQPTTPPSPSSAPAATPQIPVTDEQRALIINMTRAGITSSADIAQAVGVTTAQARAIRAHITMGTYE